MTRIGTPLSPTATRVMLCGCGELGKEVVIELQRLGVEVIAVDRYANAPAMQVAHRSHVINMLDGAALRAVIEAEKPHFIVPEIEAIATATLVELEAEGFTVIPTARATSLTMNREGIRRLAAEELDLPTSPYHFADTFEDYSAAVLDLGFPCVVKPVMSSSGKGQSLLRSADDVKAAWDYAQEGGRAGKGRVIVEGFIDFDYEITLLTVRHVGGTTFCAPVGHRQEKGDYQESWQPQAMSPIALAESERVARAVTEALGGRGLFGVELFIKGDQVWFSEVSPRPHDTGLVTLISQDLSQFALHARAILGLPIPLIRQFGPSASAVILVEGQSTQTAFANLGAALSEPDTALRLFGKPEVNGQRRMGVALARDESIEAARAKATRAAKAAGRSSAAAASAGAAAITSGDCDTGGNVSSSSGRSCPRRLTLRDRSTANTAAASVEEMIAPMSRPVHSGRSKAHIAVSPATSAVMSTPAVASAVPWFSTGLISSQLVEMPPLNRMNASATTPRVWATSALSNSIPPGPSEPASIPTARKTSSPGIPRLDESRLATTPSSSNEDAMSTSAVPLIATPSSARRTTFAVCLLRRPVATLWQDILAGTRR